MDIFRFQVTEEYEDERIDKYISQLIDSLSRSFIQKMLKDGKVQVDGKPVKANYRLKTDEEIVFVKINSTPADCPGSNGVFANASLTII